MLRRPAALLVALPLLHALAVHAASADEDPEANPAPRESISVTGERERAPDWNYRRQHLLPEVDAASNAITVTKRSSVARLDEQPPVLDNDVRALFARLPGLFVSEQQNPSQWNFSYRGLGNPQESEFVLVLQDGLPIESDWIGFPTIYYTPMPQAIESVQLIRGGASLLYGPQPAPVLNFVSRPTDPRVGIGGGSAENVFGAHRMFSTFETWSGRREGWDFRVNAGQRRGEGERSNGDYRVTQGDLHAGYVIDPRRRLDLDLHGYGSTSGDPGRLSLARYQADRDTTSTPFNRVWVERDTAVLRYEDKPDARSGLVAKLWTGWQDLARRTAAAAVAPQPQPATTVVEDQRFRYTGLDVRWLQRWSRANAFTAGAVLYDSTSPWRQYISGDLAAPRGDTNGTPRLSEDRQARYGAVFAENVFRFGPFHLVPSLRWEHEELRVDEGVKPANLSRPLIHADYRKDIPLAGIGFGNDFGPGNETYMNVSQGYRPLRYLDVAGPFANFAAGNNPDPPRSMSYEAGVHGWPARGFYYDVGLFEVDFRHRIETQAVNATDVVNVNTGDTRHRGLEAEAHYDVAPWLHRPASEHLEIFGNASLLDARFTASAIAGQVGRVPAYAPRYLLRGGVLWRDAADSRAGLSVTSVGSQFWQDSNADFGSGAAFVPARIPAFTVVDLSGQWAVTPRVRLIAALSNALDSRYYARVFQNAIEPANRRAWRAGATIDF